MDVAATSYHAETESAKMKVEILENSVLILKHIEKLNMKFEFKQKIDQTTNIKNSKDVGSLFLNKSKLGF